MEINEIEDLIDSYGKVIFGFCVKLTGNRDDAEELYQQTFLKALEMKSRIHVNKNPKSFLVSLAIGIWKNDSRKKSRRLSITNNIDLDENEFNQIPADSLNIEEIVINNEIRELINYIINNLNDKYRIVMIMYYSLDMKTEEIAKALKIPKGTIKSRLHKGRKLVKKGLEENNYG